MTATSNTKSRFIRIAQVAEELDISERSAWRLIEQGELPVHGFGGSTRVKREDLDAYIERCRRITIPVADDRNEDVPAE